MKVGTFLSLSECDGSDTTVRDTRTCTVAMTTFLAVPMLQVEGDLIVVIVESLNAIGYSDPSAENGDGALV